MCKCACRVKNKSDVGVGDDDKVSPLFFEEVEKKNEKKAKKSEKVSLFCCTERRKKLRFALNLEALSAFPRASSVLSLSLRVETTSSDSYATRENEVANSERERRRRKQGNK